MYCNDSLSEQLLYRIIFKEWNLTSLVNRTVALSKGRLLTSVSIGLKLVNPFQAPSGLDSTWMGYFLVTLAATGKGLNKGTAWGRMCFYH